MPEEILFVKSTRLLDVRYQFPGVGCCHLFYGCDKLTEGSKPDRHVTDVGAKEELRGLLSIATVFTVQDGKFPVVRHLLEKTSGLCPVTGLLLIAVCAILAGCLRVRNY